MQGPSRAADVTETEFYPGKIEVFRIPHWTSVSLFEVPVRVEMGLPGGAHGRL